MYRAPFTPTNPEDCIPGVKPGSEAPHSIFDTMAKISEGHFPSIFLGSRVQEVGFLSFFWSSQGQRHPYPLFGLPVRNAFRGSRLR